MNPEQLVQYLTLNCDCWKGKEEILANFSKEELETLAKNLALVKIVNAAGIPDEKMNPNGLIDILTNGLKEAEVPVINSDNDDEEDDNDDEETPVTTDAWLKTVPAEVAEAFTEAKKITQNKKSELVQKLVSNMAEDKREAKTKTLMTKSIAELEELTELIPQPVANGNSGKKSNGRFADFIGSAGTSTPTMNSNSKKTFADETPSIDWVQNATSLSK
jgi:hypothetical protein